jgi:hypothetical protein
MDWLTGVVIGLHVASAHIPQGNENNFNPGIYARMPSGLTVGTYYNSVRRQSFYAGYTYDLFGPVSVTVGGVTGYNKFGPVAPMVVPSLSLGAVRFSVIPPVAGIPSVVHLSLEHKF